MTEHAIVAVANENHNNGYVSNLLSMMNLAQYQGQSAQPGLSVSTLSKITIKLPDLATQEQCFNVLNLIDQKSKSTTKSTKSWKLWLKPSMTTGLCSLISQTRMANPTNHQVERWSITKNSNANPWGLGSVKSRWTPNCYREKRCKFWYWKWEIWFWTTANSPIKADEFSFEGKAILIAGNGNFYVNFTEGKFEAYQRTYVIQSEDENMLIFMYIACLQSTRKTPVRDLMALSLNILPLEMLIT